MSEIILTVDGIDPVELYGENNVKLNLLRKAFPEITITSRGNSVKLVVKYWRNVGLLPSQQISYCQVKNIAFFSCAGASKGPANATKECSQNPYSEVFLVLQMFDSFRNDGAKQVRKMAALKML